MSNENQKPILVTGSHRSGTTWVGKMIDLSPNIGFVKEPFNYNYRPGLCRYKVDWWFPYINPSKNSSRYDESIENLIKFKYNLKHHLKNLSNLIDVARLVRDFSKFTYYSISHKRILIKDPNAFFMAEYLYLKYNFNIIYTIRHPCGFISSLKNLNWNHDFNHFMQQDELMSKLTNYKNEIKQAINNNLNIIDQGILLWRILYSYLSNLNEKYSNWIILKHEELSRNPENEFAIVFSKLGLEYNEDIKRKLVSFTTKGKTDPFSVHRNSEKNIMIWKKRLSDEEIEHIKEKTESVWRLFYSSNDW